MNGINTGKIYIILNMINGKFYIGKTTKSLKYRMSRHIIKAKSHNNTYLYDAMNHYGYDAFEIHLIEYCDSCKWNINYREIYWISMLRSNNRDIGYNMTIGGDGGTMSDDSIRKMINTRKRTYIVTDKTKKKHSDNMKEQYNSGARTRCKSSEVRKKISDTLKRKGIKPPGFFAKGKDHPCFGTHLSDERKAKISAFFKGKPSFNTQESINRKRDRWTGKGNPNYVQIDKKKLEYLITCTDLTMVEIGKEFGISYATVINKSKKFWKVTPGKMRKQYVEKTCICANH